jgi:phospholipid/cholesterol/gamma-HCH transport system substrate-binding protein
METRASYLLVGVFALLAIAGFAIAIVWMAGVNLHDASARYDIFFKGSVSGLKEGNAVRYRGIPVGVVTAMEINPDNVEEVRVTIEIPQKTPVKTDTVAGLDYQGITGVAYIELSGGTHQAPLLEAKPDQKRPVIASKPSQLQELFDTAPELVSRITGLVDRLSILLNPQNQENIARVLDNIRTVTGVLAEHSGEIGGAITDATVTMKDARAAAKEAEAALHEIGGLAKSLQTLSVNLDKEFTGVGPEAKDTLAEVRKTAVEFKRAAVVLSDLIDRNREPVNTFAASGLYELTQLLTETRVLIGALTRISSQIERDPARFLFGKSQPGLEVK